MNEIMRQKLVFGCNGEYGLDDVVPKNHFFSMNEVLCKDSRPLYSVDGRIMQADTLHLTDAGAVFVSKELKSWLLENGHLSAK